MSIPVIINGAKGKMGQLTIKALEALPDFSIVGCPTKEDNLEKMIKDQKAKIVIDFTNAHSVFTNTNTIIRAGAHPIIGTSGLVKGQIQMLQNECRTMHLGGLIIPNFSIGAVLMMKYAEKIVQYFPNVEIIEMHHAGKLDSPSGTAIRTAELLANSRPLFPEKTGPIRQTIDGARGANYQDIPIHSIRLPGLLANQQIIFGNTGETLTLRHDTIDRECFIPGIILSCKKVLGLKELVYGLEHILEDTVVS
ncbi:MAG: 4-hydroxy-tetrahydrodipicolinate reductase [Gammaproteobacteria bacterium]|nr:4-hydroxy-tetrahydrodipicolinate reductase [Gammaproteobacteria bacterium]